MKYLWLFDTFEVRLQSTEEERSQLAAKQSTVV